MPKIQQYRTPEELAKALKSCAKDKVRMLGPQQIMTDETRKT